ncbi:hypothetical protein AMTR_s00124p00083680 [Amborella trichopoda]|uniref:Uncharacterized protein n=1 Tax=Amborella trichopoda TaxID=13333 RepID=W1NR37_AMBTC|nr:hypothetical protein AMTR_s00124p00083680 [Amborella trichopoda]
MVGSGYEEALPMDEKPPYPRKTNLVVASPPKRSVITKPTYDRQQPLNFMIGGVVNSSMACGSAVEDGLLRLPGNGDKSSIAAARTMSCGGDDHGGTHEDDQSIEDLAMKGRLPSGDVNQQQNICTTSLDVAAAIVVSMPNNSLEDCGDNHGGSHEDRKSVSDLVVEQMLDTAPASVLAQ